MISDTRFMKTVSDRRTVTSANWQTNVEMENDWKHKLRLDNSILSFLTIITT